MRKHVTRFWALAFGLVIPAVAGGSDLLLCPQGSRLVGDTPPLSLERWCQKADASGHPTRHGRWTEFYMNGQKAREGDYSEGKRVGIWTWWYPNGMKMQQGYFLGDRPVGRWQFWHDDGSPRAVAMVGQPAPPQVAFEDIARGMTRNFK